MSYGAGNKKDGKHYWLTPPSLYDEVRKELGDDWFDPCPFPRPDDFDGLAVDWSDANYVNPPFGSFVREPGKRPVGVTAWVRKAIAEYQKGNKVVFVYPIDKWVLMMIAAGAEIKNMGDVKWLATEDGSVGPGTGRHIAMFVLDPDKDK